MKLPNGDKAVISSSKIEGYCLNFQNPKGKDKAYLFQKIYGITVANAEILHEALRKAAATIDVSENETEETEYGINGFIFQCRKTTIPLE